MNKIILQVHKSDIAYELPTDVVELKKVLSGIFKKHHINFDVLLTFIQEEVKTPVIEKL